MDNRSQIKETRRKQIVVNIEEQFSTKFNEIADKEGVSASTLGRRLIVRHLMEQGVLPMEAVLDSVL